LNRIVRVGIAALVIAAAGCARSAGRERAPLPFAADTVRTTVVAPGVIHRFIYQNRGPWAIYVLSVDTRRCWAFEAVKAGNVLIGREKTSALVRDHAGTTSRTVVAGVNADFFRFDPPGVPVSADVHDGLVIAPPSERPVFAIDSLGKPHVLRLTIVGDTAARPIRLAPIHPREAVGGFPVLLRDSLEAPRLDSTGAATFSARNPRTAIGYSRDGRRYWLVVVDGRQKPYSDGMTLRELAAFLRSLGAVEALNLDGGGSSTMVVRDTAGFRIMNRPSDKEGERPVANALVVVAPARCDPG
jgi:hypothetical protein